MIYRLLVGTSVDPDQLASMKLADLDPHLLLYVPSQQLWSDQMASMKLADLDPHCFQDSFCLFV